MSSREQIVVHITSGKSNDWRAALRNLANLYEHDAISPPASRLKVVVNGDAVRFVLATAPEAEQLTQIADAGIKTNAYVHTL